eukprot:3294771-Pyramimonas_sp.AAC.1
MVADGTASAYGEALGLETPAQAGAIIVHRAMLRSQELQLIEKQCAGGCRNEVTAMILNPSS